MNRKQTTKGIFLCLIGLVSLLIGTGCNNLSALLTDDDQNEPETVSINADVAVSYTHLTLPTNREV